VKILQVHNFYQQMGGEDLVVADEARLLESRGHEIVRYTVHNDEVRSLSGLTLGHRTIWSRPTYRNIRAVIARERPQLLHVHNTLPLVSPSVYYAASDDHLPVVQTLHNYRLMCPASLCFRDGKVCTECVGKPIAWAAIRHACYRESRMATSAIVAMLTVHRLLGTWRNKTSVYIALTEMAKRMFVDAGLPANKLVVKPNFVEPDPGAGDGTGGYAMFVGRLSLEKGIDTLLDAWRGIGDQVPLIVVGDGPLAPKVAAAAKELTGVTWLGKRSPQDIMLLLRDARCLVFPSECFETFGRAIVEAFAAGTPVIAAGHGASAELVTDGVTGLHFRVGDPVDLAATIMHLASHPELAVRMRTAARTAFEERYTADANYRSLLTVYAKAMASPTLASALLEN
jgi:glycosyltransferase involved in cell wall biosynthesis